MLLQQEETAISLRQTKPVSYAFKVLNSQETVFHYKKRIGYFFNYLRLPGSDLAPQAVAFMSHATREGQEYVEEAIINYLDYQKQRVKNHELDFEAWNNRNWPLFEELHSPDVLVVNFNGNTTRGIDQHLQWAMAAVSAQPESRVLAHPIKIAAGDWKAVTGALPGNLTAVTIAHWEDGRITEEYLFLQSPPAQMMMTQTGDSQ